MTFCEVCDGEISWPPHQFKHIHWRVLGGTEDPVEKYWVCDGCVQKEWPEWARNSGKETIDEETMIDFELHMVSVCRRFKETNTCMDWVSGRMVPRRSGVAETQ